MQHCDQTCHWCATDWWRWLKSREAQMSNVRTKRGEVTSFAAAAGTSVRPPKLTPGTSVRVANLTYHHTARVLRNVGAPGGDGRHWVHVEVLSGLGGEPWEVHVEAHMLEECPQ